MGSDKESGELPRDAATAGPRWKAPIRRQFTAQEVGNAIAYLRSHHASLIKLLEDVVTGKRPVINMEDDNDYYEKDDYYSKMGDIFNALVVAGFADNGSQATDLFIALRNEIRRQNGISQ